jgi:polysaccharide biosynthesis protein PslE
MVIQLSPRNIAYTLFKRWKVFVAFNIGVVILTVLVMYILFWNFESTAQIVPNFSNQDLADAQLDQQTSGGSSGQGQTSGDVAKLELESMANTAASYDVERNTVLTVGWQKMYPHLVNHPPVFFGTALDQAIKSLDDDLDVSVGKDSATLEFSLQNMNPEVAQKALQVLLGYYQQVQAQVERDPRAEILRQQLDKAKIRVDTAENLLLDFKRRVNVNDLTTERSLLLNQRDDYEEDLSQSLSTLNGNIGLRDELRKQAAATSENIGISDENDETKDRLDAAKSSELQAENAYLSAQQTYKKGTEVLKDKEAALDLAKKQYADLAKESAARVRTGPNPVWQSIKTQLEQTEAAVAQSQAITDVWKDRLSQVAARLAHLDDVEGDEDALERQLSASQQDYSDYLLRTEESRVKSDLANQYASSLTVVQQPSLPYIPKRLVLVLCIAAATAVLGGVGLCLGLEVVDETIGTPQNVEPTLGLPVLITLNANNGRRKRNGKRAAA